MTAHSTGTARRSLSFGVALAAAYYWAHLYLRAGPLDPTAHTLGYLATVVPVATLAGVGLLLALGRGRIAPASGRYLRWIAGFVVLTTLSSTARGDSGTLLSAGLLGLVLAWIAVSRPTVRVETLNALFLASMLAGALAYLTDLSPYGLLPGQYDEGSDRGIQWRVSMFPLIPESGFLALLVLLFNRLHGSGGLRLTWLVLSGYFLVFSGVRSALFAWMLCEFYILVHRHTRPKQTTRRVLTVLMLLVVFVLGVAGSSVLLLLPGLADSPFSSWLFREASADLSRQSLEQSIYRSWLWTRHLELFFTSPLFGVGSYNFGEVIGSLVDGAADTGSESYLTFWLSRVGLCLLPLLALLAALLRHAVRQPGPLQVCAFIVFMVAALAYGSILVPYNLMFLLIFGIMMADSPASAAASPGALDQR